MAQALSPSISDRERAEQVGLPARLLEHVIDRIVASGLQIASITREPELGLDLHSTLREVIENLDGALGELRSAAAVTSGIEPARASRRVVPWGQARSLEDLVAAAAATRPPPGRRLRRVGEPEIFAYAPRDGRFFRTSDHAPWAREHNGRLSAVRSGATLALRSGVVYYHPESNQPLYIEN